MKTMQINQIVTIRSQAEKFYGQEQEITGGTVIKVSPTCKRVEVACDAGIRVFYQSPRSLVYLEKGNDLYRLVA